MQSRTDTTTASAGLRDPVLPRVGYVTIQDIRAWKAWPKNEVGHIGNSFMLAAVLRELGLPVEYFGPLPTASSPLVYLRSRVHGLLPGRFIRSVEPGVLRRQAACIQRRLAATPVDVLLGNNSRPFAALDTPLPIVVWRDATFAGALKVHRDFRNISIRSIRMGHRMEQAALDRCTIAVFRSQWAADDAISVYALDPGKVCVIPTGGNIRHPPPRERVSAMIDARRPERCELLFVGVDWEGKGGPVAVEVVRRLIDGGLNARLTVVGARHRSISGLPPYVRDVGFIDIFTAQGRHDYTRLLEQAHFLLFPSRVDTYGNVLPEANAHGVPCLASDNAGAPSIIRNDVNGRLFPIDSDDEAGAYCEFIARTMRDIDGYRSLAGSSYEEYVSRLSWDVVGPRLVKVLRDACALKSRDV